MLRQILRRFYLRVLEKRASGFPGELNRPAVVFSPHYDDETLGAGGTLIQKCRAGAPVHLVFMTDGGRSHAHAIDGPSLSRMRKDEAREAAEVLGIPPGNITFLEFPEMELASHEDKILERVSELLLKLSCAEVFLPSTLEPLLWSADHNVTTRVIFNALRRCGLRPWIIEYLVWYWYQWPWVPLEGGASGRRLIRLTAASRFGLSGCRELNTVVQIADVLFHKRHALEKYRSQMTPLSVDKPWPVLPDVAQGEFLKQLLYRKEFFKCYPFGADGRSAR